MTVPRSIFRLLPILLIVIGSALAACVVPPEVPATGDGPAAESQPLRIVTSGSIVADWVHQIGGDHVEVSALVPPGGDMHMFQPGPQDVARVADADMVVMIGMGLETGWLDQLFEQARADQAVVISLEEFIDPLPYLPMGGAEDAHGDEEGTTMRMPMATRKGTATMRMPMATRKGTATTKMPMTTRKSTATTKMPTGTTRMRTRTMRMPTATKKTTTTRTHMATMPTRTTRTGTKRRWRTHMATTTTNMARMIRTSGSIRRGFAQL